MSAATTTTFIADAVLFDMDGTLVDSIAAVEAAWGKVAVDIGQDPEYVIAATHGKRAIDNLREFKPHIQSHEMNDEVENFEKTILAFADEYSVHQKKRRSSMASNVSSGASTPLSSAPSSRRSSMANSRRSSMNSGKFDFGFSRSAFGMSKIPDANMPEVQSPEQEIDYEELEEDLEEAWELEEEVLDRSVQILPGVRRMMESIPAGRYAVATSGAHTYAYGAMTRVGIVPPPVTITADDARLKAGKPAPDPFLLAAECLGFDCGKCVVFEDSPSGIRAGVASGATVVAVCTSHEREKIKDCGAHFVLENMESIHCYPQPDGKLRFEITGQ